MSSSTNTTSSPRERSTPVLRADVQAERARGGARSARRSARPARAGLARGPGVVDHEDLRAEPLRGLRSDRGERHLEVGQARPRGDHDRGGGHAAGQSRFGVRWSCSCTTATAPPAARSARSRICCGWSASGSASARSCSSATPRTLARARAAAGLLRGGSQPGDVAKRGAPERGAGGARAQPSPGVRLARARGGAWRGGAGGAASAPVPARVRRRRVLHAGRASARAATAATRSRACCATAGAARARRSRTAPRSRCGSAA